MKNTWIIVALVAIIGVLLVISLSGKPKPNVMEEIGEKGEQSSDVLPVAEGDIYMFEGDSVISWTGKKILVSTKHEGKLDVTGSVIINAGKVVGGTAVFDMTSLVADGTGVVDHLKSDDWFSVETYPTATFTLATVTNGQASGQLTIRNITKPITFPLVTTVNNDLVTLEGDFQFDRTQWDITFGSGSFFKDLGDGVIDDMVSLSFTLVASPEAPIVE